MNKKIYAILFVLTLYILFPCVIIWEHYMESAPSAEVDLGLFGEEESLFDEELVDEPEMGALASFFEKYKPIFTTMFSTFAYFFCLNQFLTGIKPKFLISWFGDAQSLLRFHITTSALIFVFMILHVITKFMLGSTIGFRHILLGLTYTTLMVLGYVFWVKTKINPFYKMFEKLNKSLTAKKVPVLTNYLEMKRLHFFLNVFAILLLQYHVYIGFHFDNFLWAGVWETPSISFWIINLDFLVMMTTYFIIKSKQPKPKKPAPKPVAKPVTPSAQGEAKPENKTDDK